MGLEVLEGWREDVLSLTVWFEFSGLKLLGDWSCWWLPRAVGFVPKVLVRGDVMGSGLACLRERREDFLCPFNAFSSYGLVLWVGIRAEA